MDIGVVLCAPEPYHFCGPAPDKLVAARECKEAHFLTVGEQALKSALSLIERGHSSSLALHLARYETGRG